MGLEFVIAVSSRSVLLLQTALAADGNIEWGIFGDDPEVAWLLIAVFLLLWLLTRVHEREQRQRPMRRHSPVTVDELARLIFKAARSRNATAWRMLFLLGGEVSEMLGDQAQSWLERHELERMKASFTRFSSVLTPGCIYIGSELDNNGHLYMKVKLPDGTIAEVPCGSVTRVGVVWRLVEPPGA